MRQELPDKSTIEWAKGPMLYNIILSSPLVFVKMYNFMQVYYWLASGSGVGASGIWLFVPGVFFLDFPIIFGSKTEAYLTRAP